MSKWIKLLSEFRVASRRGGTAEHLVTELENETRRGTTVQLQTRNGSVFAKEIIDSDGAVVEIKTEGETVKVDLKDVQCIIPYAPVRGFKDQDIDRP